MKASAGSKSVKSDEPNAAPPIQANRPGANPRHMVTPTPLRTASNPPSQRFGKRNTHGSSSRRKDIQEAYDELADLHDDDHHEYKEKDAEDDDIRSYEDSADDFADEDESVQNAGDGDDDHERMGCRSGGCHKNPRMPMTHMMSLMGRGEAMRILTAMILKQPCHVTRVKMAVLLPVPIVLVTTHSIQPVECQREPLRQRLIQ